MMKFSLICIVGLFCVAGIQAQTNVSSSNERTVVILSEKTRYEILSVDTLTVKLDKYTGRTYRYDTNRSRRWTQMEVSGGLPASSVNLSPKYEIYVDNNQYFLLNNETGQSWLYYSTGWLPIEN